jgi:pyruvate/2-oxoglutarate dehydrogenase complex dihydrolipoamide dehydrogenase (E3) component
MTAERFDAIVIGAGQAGPALCARLDREGLKTALIERRRLGGTCVNDGCVPTKTLVASAHAAHLARRGSEFGFVAGEVRVDMKAVKGRKDAVVRQSQDGLASWLGGMKNVSLIEGHARFSAPKTVASTSFRGVHATVVRANQLRINGAKISTPQASPCHQVDQLPRRSLGGRR